MSEHAAIKSIGVWTPGPLGDLIMATPAFAAIANAYPGARCVAYAPAGGAALLAGSPSFEEIVTRERAAMRAAKQIRRGDHDLFFVFANSLRSALAAWFGGARQRVGLASAGRSLLLTAAIKRVRGRHSQDPAPMVETYLEFIAAAGVAAPASAAVTLRTLESERRHAEEILSSVGVDARDRLIAISPGAAYGGAKRWPVERFAAVARRLIAESRAPIRVVLLYAPDEQSLIDEIVKLCPDAGASLVSARIPLGAAKAVMERASLHITNDTGSRHIGHAFGTPTIAILGPTHQEWSRYPGQVVQVIQVDLECGPCMKRDCPLGTHRCMFDVNVEQVIELSKTWLEPKLQ